MVTCKTPLSHANLLFLINSLVSHPSYDDLLFLAMVLTGFHTLMRLRELAFPDKKSLGNYHKIALRHSVSLMLRQYSFFLPYHKGDCFFEGNTILVQQTNTPTDPYKPFLVYLEVRDVRFPLNPELWLTSRGQVPTRHWFMSHLRRFFPADAGADPTTIQAVGCWSSDTFQIYIRKNPVLIHAFLFGCPAHQLVFITGRGRGSGGFFFMLRVRGYQY